MSRWIWLPALWLVAAACSSGSPHPAAAVTSPASVPATNQHPGGLVGVIDTARITAVCANAKQAQEVLPMGGQAVTEPLVADAALLERPPVDPKAAADAAAIRRDLHQGQQEAALKVALAYCNPR